MANKSVTELYRDAAALIPEAMAPHIAQIVNARIASAITVEHNLSAVEEQFTETHHGKNLNFTKVKSCANPLKTVHKMLARQKVYELAELIPNQPNNRVLIVAPDDGEIRQFGALPNVEFLPFLQAVDGLGPRDALLALALSRCRTSVAADPTKWSSYQVLLSLVKEKAASPLVYVGNTDFFKKYYEACGQDARWSAKIYDLVVVTERAAAYFTEECWVNLAEITAAKEIFYYSPFVPEVMVGPLTPLDVYRYREYNKTTGINVFIPRFTEIESHDLPFDSFPSTKRRVESFFTGNKDDLWGVLAWGNDVGVKAGDQFAAPLVSWRLLGAINPIIVQVDLQRFSRRSHMLPQVLYDNGTYVVGKWTPTRSAWIKAFVYVVPKYRATVRVPRVTQLTKAWHTLVTCQDVHEHEARASLHLKAMDPIANAYVPLEFWDGLITYVLRVNSKVRDDKEFISSVIGYAHKMLGAQTMVGALSISSKSFTVEPQYLLDLAFAAIQVVRHDLNKVRKLHKDTGLWAKIKAYVVCSITDSWIGDFLDWLYEGKKWVEPLPSELNTFCEAHSMGLRYEIAIPEPPEMKFPVISLPPLPEEEGSLPELPSVDKDEEFDRPPRRRRQYKDTSSDSEESVSSESDESVEFVIDGEDDLSEEEAEEDEALEEVPLLRLPAWHGVPLPPPLTPPEVVQAISLLDRIDYDRKRWRWSAIWNGKIVTSPKDMYCDPLDINDQPYVDLKVPLSDWMLEARKIGVGAGWHLRSTLPEEVDKEDPILNFMSKCVGQVVLTKHMAYRPTPVTIHYGKDEFKERRAKLQSTFKNDITLDGYQKANGLDKALMGFAIGCKDAATTGLYYTVENVIRLEGGPGCGKSDATRRFMTSELIKSYVRNKTALTFNVLVPVGELALDYGHIYLGAPGGVDLTGTVEVKTLHKSTEFRQSDYLFVDEFYLVGAEFLAMAIYKTRPKWLVLMGDSLQNHILPEHGKAILNRWPMLDDTLRYRMCVNFRNPKKHVVHLSNEYCKPKGVFMIAGRSDDEGEVFTVNGQCPLSWLTETSDSKIPLICPKNKKPITWFTITNPDKEVLAQQMQGIEADEFKTGRAMQGKTFDNVGVLMTPSAIGLFRNVNAAPFVAFSRHRYNLYIVAPVGQMAYALGNIAACLNPRMSLEVNAIFEQNAVGYPIPDNEDVKVDEPAPASAAVMPDRSTHDAYMHALSAVDPNVAHISEVVASFPYDPRGEKGDSVKPYKVHAPINVSMGSGGRLLEDFKPVLTAGDNQTPLLSQVGGAHATARTAVGRFTKREKGMLTPEAQKFSSKLVDDYLGDVKDSGRLYKLREAPETLNTVMRGWYEDARVKKYFQRLGADFNGVLDLNMLQLKRSEGVAVCLERFAVHITQKAQIKAVNQQKGLNPEKVGQPVSAMELKVVITYAVLCRYLTVLDMQSGKDSKYLKLVEHNGRDVREVSADISTWLNSLGPDSLNMTVASSDIAESDIRMGEVHHYMCRRYWNALLPGCDGLVTQMLSAFGAGQKLSTGRLEIFQAFQNLSGSTWTLLMITTIQKIVNHYIFPTAWGNIVNLYRLESNIGDDAIIVQQHMLTDSFKKEMNLRRNEVVLKLGMDFTLTVVGQGDAIEFVGHIVQLDQGRLKFTPSLSRRVKKFLHTQWPTDKREAERLFYERKKALLDYFKDYEAQKSDIISADAQLLYNDSEDTGLSLELQKSRAKEKANAIWEWWESLAHVTFEQFSNLLQLSEQWRNVRIYTAEGGVRLT